MKKNQKSAKSTSTKSTKKPNKDQKKPVVKEAAKKAQPAVKAVAKKTAVKEVAAKAPVAPVAKVADKKGIAKEVIVTKKTAAIAVVKSTVVTKVTMGLGKVIEPLSWDAVKPKLQSTPVKSAKKDKEDPADVKSYSIKARYTVGDRLMHDDFGKGLVRDVIGDFKIRVAFRDFEKILVHGINN